MHTSDGLPTSGGERGGCQDFGPLQKGRTVLQSPEQAERGGCSLPRISKVKAAPSELRGRDRTPQDGFTTRLYGGGGRGTGAATRKGLQLLPLGSFGCNNRKKGILEKGLSILKLPLRKKGERRRNSGTEALRQREKNGGLVQNVAS